MPIFEARCFVSSKMDELDGLILVKEAKGASIKAAREAAAGKVVQLLLAQPTATAQSTHSPSG